MTNITSLLALVGLLCSLLYPVSAYSRDGKTDWNYFEEWFMEDKKLREANKRTITDSENARGQHTFWNLRKASGIGSMGIVKAHKNGKKEELRCGMVFYYPGFWQTKKVMGELLSDDIRKWAFEQPLAVSPICNPEPDEDWPNRKENMIVFHNYYTGPAEHDMYLLLEDGPIQPDPSVLVQNISDFKSYSLLFPDEERNLVKGSFKTPPDAGQVFKWLKDYSKDFHVGTVPNPYVMGISDTAWPEWSQVDRFWGYNSQGDRRAKPVDGYPAE